MKKKIKWASTKNIVVNKNDKPTFIGNTPATHINLALATAELSKRIMEWDTSEGGNII